jgi:type I restriction-modification system DNA methylase subunit
VLEWSKHKEQIKSYVTRGDYVILTNLKEWFFFSRSLNPTDPEPFLKIDLHKFIVEYENYGKNFKEFCDRKEYQAVRFELDKQFLASLDQWVKKLSAVKFEVDEKRKLDLIIGLINKFIFIETLDDYGVIGFKWIQENWQHYESQWVPKGKAVMLEEFLHAVDKWFFKYYDTELFKDDALHYVEKEKENIELFYETLRDVLGVTYLQKAISFKGIIQYNFRLIDEDVFGKAYETFLAGVRHDEGVYYTPKYITQYIAENTVGRVFDELLIQIREKINAEDFERAKKLVKRFTSVSVLDPACGSGSFLIKAIRLISERYGMLNQLIDDSEKALIKKNAGHLGSLNPPCEVKVKFEHIDEIKKISGPKTGRELISKILVRHIHGNDLDSMALEVAKVNIWLEAIKLSPKEFRYDKLPAETNYILPILGINLCNGDSVFGLPEDMTVDLLVGSHRADVVRLWGLWQDYVNNPMQPELVDKIEEIKEKLRRELDSEFRRILEEKQLSQVLNESKPFHWTLEFWHFFFDMTGNPLPRNERGADIVLGNPPYERIQVLKKKSPAYVKYLDNAGFHAATKNYDLAVIFIEKGVKLLKEMGEFGYIVTNKFIQADYGEGIRDYLSESKFIRELIDFGDQQVFDDATTYTVLTFLSSRPIEALKYALIRKLERTLDQLMTVKNNEKLDESSITMLIQRTDTLSERPWVFLKNREEEILDKMRDYNTLSKIARIFVGLQTSADTVYVMNLRQDEGALVRVYSKSKNREYVLERDLLRPMLMGRDIKRWLIDKFQAMVLFPYKIQDGKAILLDKETLEQRYPKTWQYLLNTREDLGKRERGTFVERSDWYGYVYLKNMDKFDLPKIMTQVLANKSTFAIDLEGKYYFPGGGNAGGYGVIPREQSLSIKFLCALLNSSFLDWNIKKISTRFRGGFYSYAKRFLERLPIKIPETPEECILSEKCEQSVNKILQLKKAQCILIELWTEWSTKIKTDEQNLEAILTQDVKNLRSGAKEIWTSTVSFYPPECDEILSGTYNDFKIISDKDQSLIKIFGINEDNNEEQIYELEFEDRDLMLHFYHSIFQTLASRAKVKTLSQLFAKTMIPIVKEVNRSPKELTPSIIKKVKEDFEKWKAEENITSIDPDIVTINNEIDNAEAEIDALVFKLYELQEKEINTVFFSLKTSPMYQAKVLKLFRKL